ncbi:hypothetical protein BJY04DRAFT_76186 [Aspergillus karnatakaensis]|uniref:uncharacterized protein n=1 Tax=Aspergillus karnatakaensis TaxID=1810916 RepID=UPI003CCD31B9
MRLVSEQRCAKDDKRFMHFKDGAERQHEDLPARGPTSVNSAVHRACALTRTGKEAGGWRTVVGLILETAWAEVSDSDDAAEGAPKDVIAGILERAQFEVPARPYGSQSESSHRTNKGSCCVTQASGSALLPQVKRFATCRLMPTATGTGITKGHEMGPFRRRIDYT